MAASSPRRSRVSINGADVSVVGTNDVPTIATTSNAFTELPDTTSQSDGSPTPIRAGTISFTDVDLTDRPVASAFFTSFTYQNASHINVTSSLTGAATRRDRRRGSAVDGGAGRRQYQQRLGELDL